MSVGSPPQGGPMLSPDGKWVWDGSRWLPLADPTTASHHAVFAAWNGIRVEAPVAVEAPPVAQAPRPAPRPAARYAAPAPPAAPVLVAAPAPEEEEVPLWRERADTGLNKYLYAAAGLIGLVVVGVVISSLGITLPWMQVTSSGPTAAAGPPPLATRSGYAQAERFLTGYLAPAMDDMNQRITTTREVCVGPVTISCQEALTETDNQAQALLAIVDKNTVPTCIATPVTRFRADLSKVHDDLQTVMKSFTGANTFQTTTYISRYAAAVPAVQADYAAINAAKATCDIALVGP